MTTGAALVIPVMGIYVLVLDSQRSTSAKVLPWNIFRFSFDGAMIALGSKIVDASIILSIISCRHSVVKPKKFQPESWNFNFIYQNIASTSGGLTASSSLTTSSSLFLNHSDLAKSSSNAFLNG